MKKNSLCEGDSCTISQNFLTFYGAWSLITMFMLYYGLKNILEFI
jgi:hypothetical protein